MNELMPLFLRTEEPSYIWYADKPPKLGGIPFKLSIEEFNRMIGNNYTFTEDLYINKKTNLNSAILQNHDCMRNELLEFIKNPLNEKLVVCYMDSKVGYGVFARENITVGEMIAVYTGEIIIKNLEFCSAYSVMHDPEANCIIEATQCGGIARFFQQLPFVANETIRKSVPTLQKNVPLLEYYVRKTLTGDNLPSEYRKESEELLKNDILYNEGQHVMKGMFLHGSDKEWQLNRLSLKNGTTIQEIATENIGNDFSVIDGKPVVYFWATTDIKKDEQLGFDYGFNYWVVSKKMPILFDINGQALSTKNYMYTEMPFMGGDSQRQFSIFYNKKMYESYALSQKPIKFRSDLKEISFFSSRKKLAKNNVIDACYLPLDPPNSFVLNLREFLGNSFKINLYERYPESNQVSERFIYDVVCKANSIKDWKEFHSLLKESKINNYCSYYETTKEIVIKGVNIHTDDMHSFMKEILREEVNLRV